MEQLPIFRFQAESSGEFMPSRVDKQIIALFQKAADVETPR